MYEDIARQIEVMQERTDAALAEAKSQQRLNRVVALAAGVLAGGGTPADAMKVVALEQRLRTEVERGGRTQV